MVTLFNYNYYFRVVKDQSEFADDQKIYERVNASLDFAYGQVTYQSYRNKYTDIDWIERKCWAIPQALWTGLVETIYHLGKGIILGSFYALTEKENKGKYFKAMVFSSIRDLQESFGKIVSIFHDAYGLYHVQEADFHKTCYELSYCNLKRVADPEIVLEEKRLKKEGRLFIKEFPSDLIDVFNDTPKKRDNFLRNVDKMDKNQLQRVKRHRLKDIPDARLNELDFDSMSAHAISDIFPYDTASTLVERRRRRERMGVLSEENFTKVLAAAKIFIPKLFDFIPSKFFHLLDYSRLKKEEVKYLFLCEKRGGEFDPVEVQDARERMAHLSREQLELVVPKFTTLQLEAMGMNAEVG